MKNVGPATKIGISVVSIIVVWFLVGVVLWLAYGMSPLIRGGYYSQRAALTLVSEFASIICVIVALVWIVSIARNDWRNLSTGAMGWRVLWRTGAALLIYATIIFVRRETWVPSRGFDDWAMFFGTVNGQFFSEAGGLLFSVEVVPAASLISAVFFVPQAMIVCRFDRILNQTKIAGE